MVWGYTLITMEKPEYSYVSHILRYVGVGLVSGSIVHAGTLGGDSLKYIVLILMGIVAFTVGTLMEHSQKFDKHLLSFILISVVVSIGTGMVSGGTQHYLDDPLFGALILPLGLFIGYLAFIVRDFKEKISVKRIVIALVISFVLWGGLYQIAHRIPVLENHHGDSASLHH